MPLDQHLQRKRDELQEQYEFLCEKIQSLNKSKIIEDLSPGERFRLKKQIEEEEANREKVEQQLDKVKKQLEELDKTASSESLYRTLIKLGYRQQVRVFRQLIEAESVACFLIHGSPEYGQRWLLNRLVVQYVPYCMTGKVVKVDLGRRVRRSDVSALWRELGGRVGLRERQPSPSDIAERVYQWWRTQNVLLVFHDADCMPEPALCELLHNFWLPLANKARNSLSQASKFKLLMFLVDYEGCVGDWTTPFAEKLDSTREPHTPIRTPRITEFSNNELMNWIEDEYDKLPFELTHKVDSTVQTILDNSDNGIPERALYEICDRCSCNWYEESEKWLKL
ncbi:MAG: hypothetical protein LDL41_18485 [Coleofasciculus sp. S288]|nr:hypothetical protein [Coleofasciculus sp. S288]